MVDDNVSFTDAADTGAGGGAGKATTSGMLDLIGTLNNEAAGKSENQSSKKGKKKKNKKKAKKGKTKKVRGADRYESQNFLFRIEGAIFCSSLVTGIVVVATLLVILFIFLIITGGNFVHYMWPFWGAPKEEPPPKE